LIDRVALAFLLMCAIALGAGAGLLFVYASDLPELRALETYRPTVVTEIYADDGQLVGSFALQRRILMTYEQVPKVLYNAVTSIEDQHFEDHWGIDFPRIAGAAFRNVQHRKITGGAILFWQERAGFEAAGGGAARRDGKRAEVFSADESGRGAEPAQPGDFPDAGRGQDHRRGSGRRAEDAAGAAYSVSAERFGAVFF
jgi:hypothetical protein